MKRIEDVTLLYEISEALNEHLDLKKALYKVSNRDLSAFTWEQECVQTRRQAKTHLYH